MIDCVFGGLFWCLSLFFSSGDVLCVALFSETNLSLDCRRQEKRDSLNCWLLQWVWGWKGHLIFHLPSQIYLGDWGRQESGLAEQSTLISQWKLEISANIYFWTATLSNVSLKVRAGVWELYLIRIDSTQLTQSTEKKFHFRLIYPSKSA